MEEKTQKKLLQTDNLKREIPETKVQKARGFLSTHNLGPDGKLEISDKDYIERYASEEDLKDLRARIEARTETDKEAWIKFPDGSMISGDNLLYGCPNCHRWLWSKPDCEECPICKGKRIRLATKKETREWWDREKAAYKKWLGEATEREERIADFNRRHFQDAGRLPISLDPTIKRG